MSSIGYKAGLISDGDLLSLAPGVIYKGSYLYDRANGAKHQMSSTASSIVCYMVEPTSWLELRQSIQKRYFATETLSHILDFLDSIGALVIVRDMRGRMANIHYRTSLLLHGVFLDRPARRYHGDLRGGIRAIAMAMRGLVGLMLLAALFGYGAGIDLDVLLAVSVLFYICMLTSTIAHEYLHLYLTARSRGSANELYQPYFLQRGFRIGMLYVRMSSSDELRSALAGPLVGAFIGIMFGSLSVVPGLKFAWVIGTSVAIFHLVSWLPAYGDGNIIREYLGGVR